MSHRFQAGRKAQQHVVATPAIAPTDPASSDASPGPDESTRTYVGHFARLAATVPAHWSIDLRDPWRYSGDDGFVSSWPLPGSSLEDAAGRAAEMIGGTLANTTWSGQPAYVVTADSPDGHVRAIVLAHPYPFTCYGMEHEFAVVMTDDEHYDEVMDSISVDPEVVTPHLYLASAIDLVESAAFVSGNVDWESLRQTLLTASREATTIEDTHPALKALVNHLHLAGDNHSFTRLASDPASAFKAVGFGMLVGGTRILAVYDDSPADRAGLLAGDVVTSLDENEPTPCFGTDPGCPFDSPGSTWSSPATVTIRREGETQPFDVTLDAAAFEAYRPVQGRRLEHDIGYIAVPEFGDPGREVEFSQAGNGLVAAIDAVPVRGWVIDLRLNFGGNYMPMVTSIASILGDGRFVGWRDRLGNDVWIDMENGQLASGGHTFANFLGDDGVHRLAISNPPVAVLTGPSTSSSGEVTTLAFVGRPGARSFGQRTDGRTTANQEFHLFDGSALFLAVSAMMDRNGVTYLDGGIEPDHPVTIDWSTFGTADDPVIAAAVEWLLHQATPT